MQWFREYPWTESFKAIELPQPLADEVSRGERSFALLDKRSPYRGDVLIVSAKGGERGGMVVGRVTLVSVEKSGRKYKFAFKNPRRIIEFPCEKIGDGSVWDCYYTKGILEEYPTEDLRWLLKKHKII